MNSRFLSVTCCLNYCYMIGVVQIMEIRERLAHVESAGRKVHSFVSARCCAMQGVMLTCIVHIVCSVLYAEGGRHFGKCECPPRRHGYCEE